MKINWIHIRHEIYALWMGWQRYTEYRKVGDKTFISTRILHDESDIENKVVIYDRPEPYTVWDILKRKQWIKRTHDANYEKTTPCILLEKGLTRTNPMWDRNKAYPVLKK